MKKIVTKQENLMSKFKIWTAFYRANPHRFAIEYFGIGLFLFQQILIYMMDKVDFFMIIASRGLGKSYLIAVYCCIRCVLYPNTRIVVASGTKAQARLLITQKIDKELRIKYKNIDREIKDIKTSTNESVVYFKNGSTIEAVVSNDNSRGYRCNILIVDEFRMVKNEVLQKILRPFLNVVRQPKFATNPLYKEKYKNYAKEENKELYLSSAWLKNHYSWNKFRTFVKGMCNEKSYFTCDLDYRLALHHGLLTESRVEAIKQEDDMNPITWDMEMEGLFYGENSNAFYTFNDLNPCRTLFKPFYPPTDKDYILKKKKYKLKKLVGEKRIIGFDVAIMGGSRNDNSVFTLLRLIPEGNNSYTKQVVYIESLNGCHSEKQAIRLKQLFYDFEADYICMDCNGNGIAVYDELVKVNYDKERDIEYLPFFTYNNVKMADRAETKVGLPVIYSIKANSTEINHEIAIALKTAFETKTIKLLVNEIDGKEFLMDNKVALARKSNAEYERLLRPYIQTSALINETVNLNYEICKGFIRIYETGTNRKDRFSSLAYANYLAKIIEKEENKKKRKNNKRKGAFCLW